MINLDNFINTQTEKYVLKLEKNDLKCVPLKETSLFDRVLAWFGFGPLSLGNIAKFISENAQKIEQDKLSALHAKLNAKITLYNARHSYNKVSFETIKAISKCVPLITSAVAKKDKTYTSEADGNVDFSYVDKESGFGYVLDGAGHNNTHMQCELKKILDTFNEKYKEMIQEKKFENITDLEEFPKFLEGVFLELGSTLINNPQFVGKGYTFAHQLNQPAMSFVQIVRFADQSYLFSVEFKNTALLIKKADGTYDRSLLINRGIINGLGGINPQVKQTLLNPGDTVIGFSSGIGEYLTLDEMEKVIDTEKNYDNLLPSLKKCIIQIGTNIEDRNSRHQKIVPANHQSEWRKLYTANNPLLTDDISLFVLTCGK